MATVIQSWRVDDNRLVELDELPLANVENRLESLLAAQPDAIRDRLLIIGRQVSTASGPLDLLGITADGLIVVVELKRDRAPRETVAQAIDYASWIADQTPEDIEAIASEYLGKSLDEAFRTRFGQPVPDIDPANLSVIVVASRLDAATERMIRFLSRQYGADIDGLLFRFLKLPSNEEVLIKTSVVSEELHIARGDRQRPTPDALIRMASERNAAPVLTSLRTLKEFLSEERAPTYGGSFRYFGRGHMLVGVNAATYWGAPIGAVDVWVSYGFWAQLYGLDESSAVEALRKFSVVPKIPGGQQLVLRVASEDEADRLIELLREWSTSSARASSDAVDGTAPILVE